MKLERSRVEINKVTKSGSGETTVGEMCYGEACTWKGDQYILVELPGALPGFLKLNGKYVNMQIIKVEFSTSVRRLHGVSITLP